MKVADLTKIRVANVEDSLAMVRSVLNNQPGPARDIVALNAGAAIYVAGVADTLAIGVSKAQQAIASGAAKEKLAQLVSVTQACVEEIA